MLIAFIGMIQEEMTRGKGKPLSSSGQASMDSTLFVVDLLAPRIEIIFGYFFHMVIFFCMFGSLLQDLIHCFPTDFEVTIYAHIFTG
jgi:hypothetical protein